VRTLLNLPAEAINAVFLSASIGVGVGSMVAVLTHRLEDGLQAGFIALVISAACFGQSIWRHHRPRPMSRTGATWFGA
jgi:hypothetical protein